MSSNELERQWRGAIFLAYVGGWARALFWVGLVPIILAIINHLEHMPW